MKNILVTGGAGFIGSHTVVELVAAGFRPVIVDNFSNSTPEAVERLEKLVGQKIAVYEQDYQDVAKLKQVVEKESIDGVIHFAAFKYVGISVADPLPYYENNVAGFITLLEIALAGQVKHFVFSSSAAVYGTPPQPETTEDTPNKPESPYGWTKLMDEIILRDTCRADASLQGVALRYFNVVGSHKSAAIGESPKQQPQNLLMLTVRAAVGKHDLVVNGTDYPTPDGTTLRDYIHVVDLARAHVAALRKTMEPSVKENFHVYNIGTGKPSSVLEIIKTFEKVNGMKIPYTVGPRRAGDPAAYYANVDKANRELGWRAEYTIEDAVRDAWNWQQKLTKEEKEK